MTKEEFQEVLWEEIKNQSKNDWFQIDLVHEVGSIYIPCSIVYNNYCLAISDAYWNGSCYALNGVSMRIFNILNSLHDDEDLFSWDEAFEYLYNDILIADDWDSPLMFKRDKDETTTWYV